MERYELTKNIKIRKWVKSNYDSKNLIIRYIIRSLYFVKKSLYIIRKICTDKEFRAIFYMSIFNAGKVHQTTPLTCMDRYPIIFSACRDYFNDNKDIKILSYGCSTGEEVLTLRKYFNDANIVGAEINKNSLKICRKLKVDDKITFINSNQNEIKKNGKFDLIFCMAVLQRTPDTITRQGVKSLKKIYPFEKFEKQIIELDSYLKKGGLMVIHFSQYSFTDVDVSSKYKALGSYNQDDYNSAIFDRNSNLITDSISRKSIFIKLEE